VIAGNNEEFKMNCKKLVNALEDAVTVSHSDARIDMISSGKARDS